MWLAADKLRKLASARKLTLNQLLRQAGVSKTAYYSLARKGSVVPDTVWNLAETLEVTPIEILSCAPPELALIHNRERKIRLIVRKYPKIDIENVRHTLILLEMPALERLQGALRRAGR